MFDSLALENPKRKWATMMSFTLEATFVGMLIAAPLAFTDKLPYLHLGDRLVAPVAMSAEPAQPPEHQPTHNTSRSEITPEGQIIAPPAIPPRIERVVDDAPIAPPGVGDSIPGAIPGVGQVNPTMRRIFDGIRPHEVAAAANVSHGPVIISHLDPGLLIHRVQPIYPRTAIIARTEGTVTLTAVIDTSGRITQLRAVSGHPLLIQAAVDAVRQWRYKPYILNGSPVEVETQVSVIFNLSNR